MLGTPPDVAEEPITIPAVTFRNDIFMQRTTRALGKKASDEDRAHYVGISRNTLNRLRRAPVALSLARAIAIANRLGVTVGELFATPVA